MFVCLLILRVVGWVVHVNVFDQAIFNNRSEVFDDPCACMVAHLPLLSEGLVETSRHFERGRLLEGATVYVLLTLDVRVAEVLLLLLNDLLKGEALLTLGKSMQGLIQLEGLLRSIPEGRGLAPGLSLIHGLIVAGAWHLGLDIV